MSNLSEHKAISIRPFIGAKDFNRSRSFYSDLGFSEIIISPSLSLYQWGEQAFYLQDAYVKDWVDNTMLFFQVENVAQFFTELVALNLTTKYPEVRIAPIRTESWGKECFLHDPSGILWHIGEFS